MSTTRFFSSLGNYVSNSRIIKLTAYFSMVAGAQLLNTMLDQEIEGSNFKDYYSDAPSRIAWLILSSLLLGINLDFVIRTLQDENRDEVPHSDRVSPKKIWVICTTAYASHSLIQNSLKAPITQENALYILSSAALNGPLWGTLATGAGYLFKKFNYNILPFTQGDIGLVGMGIIMSTLKELLDYICKQMIDHQSLEWNSLVSPERLFALHVYNSLLQGVTYGISFCSARKYSRVERPQDESVILKIRNSLLISAIMIVPISIFTQKALTVPIDENNAGIIICQSLATGFPYALSSACTTFTMVKLKLEYDDGLNQHSINAYRESLLSRNNFLPDRTQDQVAEAEAEAKYVYVPPDQIQTYQP